MTILVVNNITRSRFLGKPFEQSVLFRAVLYAKKRLDYLVTKISRHSHNMANKLSQRACLFNCDGTYKLDAVERFLMEVQEKYGFEFSTDKRYFGVNEIRKFCETIIPQLKMDFAIFVVHAEESRLSINEDNAGIGYTKIYRALLQATGKWSGSLRSRNLPVTKSKRKLLSTRELTKCGKYRQTFGYSFKKRLKVNCNSEKNWVLR